MVYTLFNELLEQNIQTCSFSFNEIKKEHLSLKLNNRTASVGFIYRHIGENMLLFGPFFGIQTAIQNTTMGHQDEGQGATLEESQNLIKEGYALLKQIIENTDEEGWKEAVDTPFFGTVSKARLFSHILYHNAYHAGQIGLSLKRAQA